MKRMAVILLFGVLLSLLFYNIMQMPSAFTTDAPSYNETTRHYTEEGAHETGAINIIAAILTDYRAFDTLGETIVLFTSIVAVASVLRMAKTPMKEESDELEEGDVDE